MPQRVKVAGNPITFVNARVKIDSSGPTLSPTDGEKDGAPDVGR